MVVIAKGALHNFIDKYPVALQPLNDWYSKTKEAEWSKFKDVKVTFNSVDFIGSDRYVFNIAGNNFRIVAMIHFSIRTIYIRAVLTHAQYNILNKTKELINL